MKRPDFPEEDAQRLACLKALNILDTESEERFDRLTRLARRLFDVPIALVSLVDTNRQWFKSCMGLDAQETGRDISFCGHAILGDDLFIIPDTLEDERFHDNPLVTSEPYIRFYAGCPLTHISGHKLGTLCLIDTRPRHFTVAELSDLEDLAVMAERELAAVQLATLDELTNISNRRGFSVLATKALNFCSRMKLPAALLFFDLDGFKEINDRLGHKEGDQALKTFADCLRSTCRESDVFGRIGGDEFATLLVDTDLDGAQQLIDRLRNALNEAQIKTVSEYLIEFSAGSLMLDEDGTCDIENLLEQADKRMYMDKGKRR
ncbi:MAG: diguanylate cyclase [Neptuniibacter sp.]